MDDKNNAAAGTSNSDDNAAKDGNNADKGTNGDDKSKAGDNNAVKTFSQEDLDRIAAKTRDEEKKKADKAIADAVAKATEEAQRQAKLSEEERNKELAEKQKRDFEEREKGVTTREHRADAIEKFAELKLPVKLVDFVVDLDKDLQDTKIASLQEAYNQAVKDGVAEALKGNAPKDVNNSGNSSAGDNKVQTQF